LSADEEARLEAWLAQDVRRVGAYAKARAVAFDTERVRALGATYDPARFRQSKRPSRRALIFSGAAAALAASVVLGVRLTAGYFKTRRGEVRVIPLDDGSVITLNTDSEMALDYSRVRRSVRLIKGEALFDVAKDPQRPFVVAAGDTQVRAIGTSFIVTRLRASPVRVLVREGVVEVKRGQERSVQRVRVTANMRAIAPNHARLVETVTVPQSEIDRELAWREGRIAFEGETLEQAAAAFGRYSEIKVVIDDPSVANERITGLFQANDPIGFARAVAISLNLTSKVTSGQVRLSR